MEKHKPDLICDFSLVLVGEFLLSCLSTVHNQSGKHWDEEKPSGIQSIRLNKLSAICILNIVLGDSVACELLYWIIKSTRLSVMQFVQQSSFSTHQL